MKDWDNEPELVRPQTRGDESVYNESHSTFVSFSFCKWMPGSLFVRTTYYLRPRVLRSLFFVKITLVERYGVGVGSADVCV